MKKIRFFLSLWAGKLVLWYYIRKGRVNDDRPGMRSMRLFFDFVRYVAKPKIVVAVTGTNGKTSITKIIADMFEAQGYSVAYNSWGANDNAGYARLFLGATDIFNRTTKDVAVVEMDEITIAYMLEMVKPQYLIINNLATDSLHRNGNPDYVSQRIIEGCNKYKDTVLIVNGDDPICCGIGENNKRVFFGIADQGQAEVKYLTNDFPVCPKCGSTPVYEYRNYRHFGEFHCPVCGYKSPKRDVFVEEIKENSLVVREGRQKAEYPVLSEALFNAYNEAAVITLFRQLGYQPEQIAELLKHAKLPENRDRTVEINGVQIHDLCSKRQNPTAMSTTMEYAGKQPGNKAIIMLYDELVKEDYRIEATPYLYSTDYQFLNDDSVKHIIVIGQRCREHKIRLLLAGVKPEKIVVAEKIEEIDPLIRFNDVDKYIILHDVTYSIAMRDHIIDVIRENILERGA